MRVSGYRILAGFVVLITSTILYAQEQSSEITPSNDSVSVQAPAGRSDETVPVNTSESGAGTVDSAQSASLPEPAPTGLPGATGDSTVKEGVTASGEKTPVSVSDTGAEADSDDQVQSLDKIVVSATRTRRRISETPASVTIIQQKEIETSAAKDINDLVANKTGVIVRRSVGMGEGVPSDISMRAIPGALAASRTLILVDGIPTNASGTPFLILNEIPVEIIDNIEIVRGPYSSLYGANAFGGVINVTTKNGFGVPTYGALFENSYPFSVLERWRRGERVGKAARSGAQQALWNGELSSSGGNEKINYLVNAGYRAIGNYLLNDSALVKAPGVQYKIPAKNYDYADLRLLGKIGYRFNDRLSAELHTRYFKSDLGFGVTRYSPDTTDIDIFAEKFIVGPKLSWKVSDAADIKAGGYLRLVNGSYMNEMGGKQISWKSHSADWQLDLQGIIRPVEGHVLTVGSEFLSNGITFGDLVNKLNDSIVSSGVYDRISNAGAYVQDEISLFGLLRLVPGVRMDYHTVFGAAFSPKLGISAAVNQFLHLRGSAGRAFRAPNHAELFMPPIPLRDSIPLMSNPDLKPEYIWAYDIGADVVPVKNMKFQIGGFYNNMRDLIGQGIVITRLKLDLPDMEYDYFITHQNISRAWSAGVEFDGEWSVVREVTLKAGYVYERSHNESASAMAEYFKKIGSDRPTDIELDYIPRHKGSAGLRLSRTFNKAKVFFTFDEMIVGTRHYLNFIQLRTGSDASDLDLSDMLKRIDPVTKELVNPRDYKVKISPPYEKLPTYLRTDLLLRCDVGRFFGTVSVQNLFNADYEESFGTLAPGRLATIKIGAQF